MNDIQSNTIGTIFKVDFKKQLPEQFITLGSVEAPAVVTNIDQIEGVLSGQGSNITTSMSTIDGSNPVIVKASPQPQSAQPEVGRNEPCPCGSGKKYKKCHQT